MKTNNSSSIVKAFRQRFLLPYFFQIVAYAPLAVSMPALQAEQTGWRVAETNFIEPAPAVAEVQASTLVEAADGSVVAAWWGGTKEGNDDVGIWVSRWQNGRWEPARLVADGTGPDGKKHPAWNPVLYRSDDGELSLFFKVGPSSKEWWGEVMVSKDNGVSWSDRRKLPEGLPGPAKNKPLQVSPEVVISPSSRQSAGKTSRVEMEISDGRFQEWKTVTVADPKKLQASQPALLLQADGSLLALCRTSTGKVARTTSQDRGQSWSPLASTDLPMIDSGLDAIALREGGFLLAYNPGEAPKNPKDTDPREPRCPMVVSFSSDAKTWTPIATLEDRPTRWGYAYPSLLQTSDGRVHVTYTWNRGRIRHVVLERATP